MKPFPLHELLLGAFQPMRQRRLANYLGLGMGAIFAAGLSRTVTTYSEPVSLTFLINEEEKS